MVAPRELKSQAAEQIQMMWAGRSSEVPFGAGKRQLPVDELLSRDLRREALRRAARTQAALRSRPLGLRAWFHR